MSLALCHWTLEVTGELPIQSVINAEPVFSLLIELTNFKTNSEVDDNIDLYLYLSLELCVYAHTHVYIYRYIALQSKWNDTLKPYMRTKNCLLCSIPKFITSILLCPLYGWCYILKMLRYPHIDITVFNRKSFSIIKYSLAFYGREIEQSAMLGVGNDWICRNAFLFSRQKSSTTGIKRCSWAGGQLCIILPHLNRLV